MEYVVRPVVHAWRRRQRRGIRSVGGVGYLPGSVEGWSASEVALELAAALFGERGRVVSLVYAARSRGRWGRWAGRMWRVTIAGGISETERCWGAVEPVVTVEVEEGIVAAADRPCGMWRRETLPGALLSSGPWRHIARPAGPAQNEDEDSAAAADMAREAAEYMREKHRRHRSGFAVI